MELAKTYSKNSHKKIMLLSSMSTMTKQNSNLLLCNCCNRDEQYNETFCYFYTNLYKKMGKLSHMLNALQTAEMELGLDGPHQLVLGQD